MKEKLNSFMKDKYGIDNLNMFLFELYFIIVIINIFINFFILTIMQIVIILIMFFRIFSKNKNKRIIEEKAFLKIKNCIKSYFIKFKNKDKYHIYKKCPKCKIIIRLPLPYSIGIKYVTCPKCKNKFKTLVLRKQKIELIKKKR